MSRYSIMIEKDNGKEKEVKAIKLKHNGKIQDKFELEVIDRYLTQFSNQDALLTKLAKDNNLPFIPTKCYIGYNYKGKVCKKDIIYNDKILFIAAKDIINQKQNGIDVKHQILTPTNDINELIGRIKNYAKNDSTLRSMFFSELFPKHVYDLLNEYHNLNKPVNYNLDTLMDRNELAKQIDYNIRKYKFFRAIHLWEIKYLKKQEKSQNNKEEYKQFELSEFMDVTDHTIPEKAKTYEDYEVEADNIDIYNKDFYNQNEVSDEELRDQMFSIYKESGIEGVMNYFDLDQLNKVLSIKYKEQMGLK